MSTRLCIELKCVIFMFYLLIFEYPPSVTGYLKILSSSTSITEADLSSRLVLYCNISKSLDQPPILWLKDGHTLTPNLSWKHYEKQGSLVSQAVLVIDAGNYSCRAKGVASHELNTLLLIKTPPLKLVNVSVHPSTVVATVRWHVEGDGGYPITHFTLIYCSLEANDSGSWHVPQPVHIGPTVRQFFVYQLKPGTSYEFRMWANNKLGPGEPTIVHASTSDAITSPEVLQHMMANSEEFTSEAWIVAVSMVMTTVIVLSCLSCILIYKEGHNTIPNEMDSSTRIITNPGFDIDLEQCYLLDHADFNDNTETAVRTNNNTVVQPSRV